uniref:Myosin motor domain-containing protein n=1 Tax=Amphimedon queenslandica TaxID=400682 RepID=A0A1X7UGE0_AMPQE
MFYIRLVGASISEPHSGEVSLPPYVCMYMNPLLKGFGNAQTTMNDNSSRFGKYLQLKFNGMRKVGITNSFGNTTLVTRLSNAMSRLNQEDHCLGTKTALGGLQHQRSGRQDSIATPS